jgi:predicted dithiol-disulfide oxidoreductase (DUF899 family)
VFATACDFHVTVDDREDAESEASGVSVFLRDGNSIFHTYSTYDRGTDLLNGTLNYLDLTPWVGRKIGRSPPAAPTHRPAAGGACTTSIDASH